jgi:hypothetical protein
MDESSKLPKSSDLILVAYIPGPHDLEIARLLGWYRIPLRTAPKVIAVDYIAFYQPASFGDTKWCIEVVAQVRGHELVTRAELLREEIDHPKASEEYFKIQLGSLVHLENPIQAGKWKRITFFYTTGKYLLRAKTIDDLIVYSEERKLLWRALRDRGSKTQPYHVTDLPEIELDTSILVKILGIKESTRDED